MEWVVEGMFVRQRTCVRSNLSFLTTVFRISENERKFNDLLKETANWLRNLFIAHYVTVKYLIGIVPLLSIMDNKIRDWVNNGIRHLVA